MTDKEVVKITVVDLLRMKSLINEYSESLEEVYFTNRYLTFLDVECTELMQIADDCIAGEYEDD